MALFIPYSATCITGEDVSSAALRCVEPGLPLCYQSPIPSFFFEFLYTMWYPVALFITLFSSGVCAAKALDSEVLLPRNLSSIDTTIIPTACMTDCYGILMTVYGCGSADSTCMCSMVYAPRMETCLHCYNTTAATDAQGKTLAKTFKNCQEQASPDTTTGTTISDIATGLDEILDSGSGAIALGLHWGGHAVSLSFVGLVLFSGALFL